LRHENPTAHLPYHLNELSRKTERYIKRKIRTLTLTREEFRAFEPALHNRPHFLVWVREVFLKNFKKSAPASNEL
jgi:hypothetical protein